MLKDLLSKGKQYLNQLHYFRTDRYRNSISPLQIAVEEGNNRAVDILLKYESFSKGMNINKISNILFNLVP